MGIGGVESMLVDIANYQIESNAVSIIVINDNISPMLQSKLDSRVKRTLGQGFDSKVIYNGIHFDQVATSPHAMGQTCHIVNVGRLQNDKGQKVLVEAAKILKKQGDIHFTIDFIGGGENETSLKELVNAYNLNDEIHFLGFKSREYVYENLCQYDLYVQPSIFEGFGLTLAEAIAAEVPVITSDLEGPVEVIAGGARTAPHSNAATQTTWPIKLSNFIAKKSPLTPEQHDSSRLKTSISRLPPKITWTNIYLYCSGKKNARQA